LDEDELAKRLQNLQAEEQLLRLELSMAEEAMMDVEEQSNEYDDGDGRASRAESNGSDQPQEDRVFSDTRRLAFRVETEVASRVKEREQVIEHAASHKSQDRPVSAATVEMQSSSDEESTQKAMSPEEAQTLLQAAQHEEMQELLQLQDDNAKLVIQIKEVQHQLQELRMSSGAMELTSDSPSSRHPLPHEKVEEANRKIRELHALRKRWWSERQDPQTTVRRALAVHDLEIDDTSKDDEPPHHEVSLFQRIQASMTMP
jgi:hypothetical protein